jgi:hypothetical protein
MMASNRLGGDADGQGGLGLFAGLRVIWTCGGWQPLVASVHPSVWG